MGSKTRYLPLHQVTSGLIVAYLAAAGHGPEDAEALLLSLHHARIEGLPKPRTPDTVYKIAQDYLGALGFEVGAHSLRATAVSAKPLQIFMGECACAHRALCAFAHRAWLSRLFG